MSEITCSQPSHVSCSQCALSKLCLPIALESDDIIRLDEIVGRGKPLHRGEHLYRQEDPFSSIYAVRAGCIKAYHISDDGEEQVTGFYMPGEVVGMDGVGRNRHASSAVALETTSVCNIPFDRLGDLSREIASLQQRCFQLMSKEIVEDRVIHSLLSKAHAEARIATFFLSISKRKEIRRLSPNQFRLPMARGEIANYLGLTVETTSRVLSKFQKTGLLAVDNKEIEILNMDGMKEAASS